MQWWISFSEIVRNFGLVFGGAVGIFLAWQRVRAANRQAEAQIRQASLARQDHVAELFNRAVGQLQDAKLEVRLGGANQSCAIKRRMIALWMAGCCLRARDGLGRVFASSFPNLR